MGFVDSMKDFFGRGEEDFEEYEEYEDEEIEEQEAPKFTRFYNRPKRDNVVSFDEAQRRTTANMSDVTIVKVRKFEEAEAVADILKSGSPVIFDVLEMEKAEDAKRVVDFISGVVCGINGNHKRVSGGIFIATPQNMVINIEENPRRGRSNWNMMNN